MSATVLLDAGPLGMATNPRSSTENEQCKNWLSALVYRGALIIIPEIADYEVRRERLSADKTSGMRAWMDNNIVNRLMATCRLLLCSSGSTSDRGFDGGRFVGASFP